jgi:hypothetical protein
MEKGEALELILRCIEQDRVILTRHFEQRMIQRGMFWGDLLVIIEQPSSAKRDGMDELGRERWLIAGRTFQGLPAELLCAIDIADPFTFMVTIYWE